MSQYQRPTADPGAVTLLLCRLPACLIGLRLASVIETMRPLPVELISGAVPVFVKGVSIIRGSPVPVVDTGQLLGGPETSPKRFVTIKTGSRAVALTFEDVVGVRTIEAKSLQELPPLLQEAKAILAIGTLDTELVSVLNSACILPEEFACKIGNIDDIDYRGPSS